MKTLFLLFIVSSAVSLWFLKQKENRGDSEEQVQGDTLVVLMGQAKFVIESKCLPCHSNKSVMPEARQRFNLDSINYLPIRKKVAKLDDMIYILEKGAMPHQRFMEMRPDGILSYADRKAIEAWADKTAVRLTRTRYEK